MRNVVSVPRKKKVSGDDAVISACIFKKKRIIKGSFSPCVFCACDRNTKFVMWMLIEFSLNDFL